MTIDLAKYVPLVLDGQRAHGYFSPAGSLPASGDYAGNIVLSTTSDFSQTRSIRGHRRCVTSLEFSPDGAMLAFTSHDLSGVPTCYIVCLYTTLPVYHIVRKN